MLYFILFESKNANIVDIIIIIGSININKTTFKNS